MSGGGLSQSVIGGVVLLASSTATFNNLTVYNNLGIAIGLFLHGAIVTINGFYGYNITNTLTSYTSLFWAIESASFVITNAEFAYISCSSCQGGVLAIVDSTAVVYNALFHDNTASSGGAIASNYSSLSL